MNLSRKPEQDAGQGSQGMGSRAKSPMMRNIMHALFAAGLMLPAGLSLLLSGCKPEELGAAHATAPDYYPDTNEFVPEPRMAVIKNEKRTPEQVAASSNGCLNCHKGIDAPSMHESKAVSIGCTDCHGGDASACNKEQAHIHPRGEHWYAQEPTRSAKRKLWVVDDKKDEKKEEKKEEEKKPAAAPQIKELKDGNEATFLDPREDALVQVTGRKDREIKDIGDPVPPAPTTPAAPTAPAADGAAAPSAPTVPAAPAPVVIDPKDIIYHDGGHGAAHAEGGHEGGHHAHAANPKRTAAAWIQESPEFIRFVNPADLRVAKYSCGGCHAEQVKAVPLSMMAHGAMLWNAALYNNGAMNQKIGRYGEAYTFDGRPARLQTIPRPTPEEIKKHGVVPFFDPLPRYNITQPGNVLRVFERGGKLKLETALPEKDNDPGKPETKLSIRGFGTLLSTDPVYLGLQKTRLLDPILWHLGSNDQAGDYRSSGCTACHAIYANDRDPTHSGPYAKFGKDGQSFSKDEALKEAVESGENGHPIKHVFTKSIPSSQCVTCHMHPGTTVTMTYYGNTWYDNETEGSKLYLASHQPKPGARQQLKIKIRNPEGSALRGMWGDVEFLESVADHNSEFKSIQFADYNGHGWLFRNVYKLDKKGNLLDKDNKIVPHDSPDKFKKGPKGEPIAGSALHMQDIHQELGMHCIDCHFSSDNHGNGKLYSAVRDATEITCADCHGTVYEKAKLLTSGNAAPRDDKDKLIGTNLAQGKTAFGTARFKWQGDTLFQYSSVYPDLKWEVMQTVDTITPGHKFYNEKSRLAKTVRNDGKTWGDVPEDPTALAHQDSKMDCYVCHTAWMASCFGCHLPMKANEARFNNHYEGAKSRNWTQYNFQTLREDVYMLGHDSTTKGNKIAPVRSTCAVLVGSQNAQREWLYSQQQTISAEGFSGQAFSSHYPHAVRGKETKTCTDCHISKNNDNNAWMAQILMQGTNQTNFMFRYVYSALGKGGVSATVVTEQDEPQAVIGSTLHRDAYPEEYAEFCKDDRKLHQHYHHSGQVYNVQLRGEYLYAARGSEGMQIYDVANIDNKDFSERIITAPVSPLGQRFYVRSKDCTSVLSPTVLGVDPTRQPPLRPRNPQNQEQGIALTYAFLYCTDRCEGLFTVLAGTLLDGDPTNNFLHRHLTYNPDGILTGAVNGQVCGNYLYVCCDAGLVIVDISKIGTELAEAATRLNPDGSKVVSLKDLEKNASPADPSLLSIVGVIPMNKPKAVRIQFRYAFVVDADGLKVVDVTEPTAASLVPTCLGIKDARNIYLSRTYAYVAGGSDGVHIVDIQHPTAPQIYMTYNAEGRLNDVYDVKIGMTNASTFAYVANGEHGLAVLQLTSPERTPNYLGWSCAPQPELIATSHTGGTCMALSEGLQRDRAVDESGNQLSVFNRVGAHPFNHEQAQKLYKIGGQLFQVSDDPKDWGEPKKPAGVDPALLAKKEELENNLKTEKNPAKKKKIAAELEEVNKQIDEQKKALGPSKKDIENQIKKLEEDLKTEKNPAKKKKIAAEIEALKNPAPKAP